MIVTARKNVSYDVNYLIKSMNEVNDRDDVSIDEALKVIWDYITEDFGDAYGVVLTDEEGNQL